MFFNGWEGLLRVLLIGVLAYAGLLLLLRISGKRTLSKMNAFDLVVTVALGSTLATITLSRDAALLEGLLAFAVLIALQYLITWSSVRWHTVSRSVKAQPTLLLYRGQLLHDAMRRERVVEAEVLAAIRDRGIASPADVTAVVLETDGSFSVLSHVEPGAAGALSAVRGYDRVTP